MQVLDAERYGWGSREWILKQAIKYAPQEHKDLTLQSLVAYLAAGPTTTATELLDLIAQGVLTGTYTQTMSREAFFSVAKPEDPGYPEHDNPQNSLDPITEEEIEEGKRWMDRVLGDADDPFDPDKEN